MLVIVTHILTFTCTIVQYGVGLTLKIAILKIILKIWYLRGPQRSVKTCTFWFKSDQTNGLLQCLRGLSRHSPSVCEPEDLEQTMLQKRETYFMSKKFPPSVCSRSAERIVVQYLITAADGQAVCQRSIVVRQLLSGERGAWRCCTAV